MPDHQRDRLRGQNVADRLMPDRISTLDRMIESAHPGSNPKPVRRLEGKQGIVDDGARQNARVPHTAFDLCVFICNASGVRIFRSRERGGDGDMDQFAFGQRVVDCDFTGIDGAAATEADETIGIGAFDFFLEFVDGAAGDMLHHAREYRCAERAKGAGHLVENRKTSERGDDYRAFEAALLHFFFEGCDFTWTVDYAFEAGQVEFADRGL